MVMLKEFKSREFVINVHFPGQADRTLSMKLQQLLFTCQKRDRSFQSIGYTQESQDVVHASALRYKIALEANTNLRRNLLAP